MSFKIFKRSDTDHARLGVIETPHGIVETPSYVMVGTHAKVRTLEPADLARTKTQLAIVNTYHMWQRLGDEGLKTYGGIHDEMGWPGPLMTDSGGFQVFSLGAAREERSSKVAKSTKYMAARPVGESLVRITEDGAYFKTASDAPEQYLDAEKSMHIQAWLGADIIFAFDEATSPYHDHDYTRVSMERTHRWAKRSLDAHSPKQLLYGIVQGGPFEDLRKESARVIGAMPFDGFGIGGSYGESFGDTQKGTYAALDWTIPFLPENKPRHFLGIGKIEDILEGVARGVDTFDCVIPTREARHGSIWTRRARLDIKRGVHADDISVLDPECGCPICHEKKLAKGELYALFKSKNFDAGRFATIHNIYFFNNLMAEIRRAIKEGRHKFVELHTRYTSSNSHELEKR